MLVVTTSQMRQIDKRAQEMGIPALILMENAGRSLAWHCDRLLRRQGKGPGATIAVLCGPGQNGGDGFCASRHLSAAGYRVKVAFFGKRDLLPYEASENLKMLSAYHVPIISLDDVSAMAPESGKPSCEKILSWLDGMNAPVVPEGPDALERTSDVEGGLNREPQALDLIVDALLGTGTKGSPRPPLDMAIRWANSKGVPIVACDIPSGLSGDTGFPYQPCIKADLTVTMGFPKIGLYTYPGRMYCGDIVVEPLGLPPSLTQDDSGSKVVFLEDASPLMPTRRPDHHKGQSGHVTVIAGSLGMTGAAVLSAKAALRAGAGTVTLLVPRDIHQVSASMVPEVMVVPCVDGPVFSPELEAIDTLRSHLKRSHAVALGPGFGRGHLQAGFLKEIMPFLSKLPCVIDADALFGLKELGGLSYLKGLEGNFILTPHPGELARLIDVSIEEIGKDRPGFARKAALEGRSIVCLKGAGTIVANPSGHVVINTSGDPAMATAGAGDVLTGTIAGLLAQGLEPFDSAWRGVFWHGLSGEIAREKRGSDGILAGEIADCLPEARQRILDYRSVSSKREVKRPFGGPEPWAR